MAEFQGLIPNTLTGLAFKAQVNYNSSEWITADRNDVTVVHRRQRYQLARKFAHVLMFNLCEFGFPERMGDVMDLGPFNAPRRILNGLLTVSGIASIVEGLARWHGFFKDILDLYRAWIRHPISWAVHLVWPTSWPQIPETVFDVIVVWGAMFFAANLWSLKENDKGFFQKQFDRYGRLRGFGWILIFLFLLPLVLAVGVVVGILTMGQGTDNDFYDAA
jgi:hypothetical protein